MATNVYIWPADIIGTSSYSPAWRLRTTTRWSGAPGQRTEHVQRSSVEFGGTVTRSQSHLLDIALHRIRGGLDFVGVWDPEMRLRNGWDNAVAAASGTEYFRADGRLSLWAGTGGGVWRSVVVTGSGSAGSTSLSVSGLKTGETIPAGTMVRAGDYRYLVAEDASESSGGATLTLATPLVEAVSGDVSLPGDFFVGRLIGQPEIGAADEAGLRTYRVVLAEVYASEVDGGFGYP